MLPIGVCAQLACVWEATARKPGNVHRFRDFDDATYLDYVVSAAAVGPVLEGGEELGVGELVLEGVRATRKLIRTNTNLGILLLLAPLARVPRAEDLRNGVRQVLADLTRDDARAVYQAIRLAAPGGLGTAPQQDVRQEPTDTLLHVMALAADRDQVAAQYGNGFREVFADGLPALAKGLQGTGCLEGAIIHCYLRLLAAHPDSLIARKRGPAEADEAARLARLTLDAGWPHQPAGREAIAALDAWLRAEGHARNPGTTADLVTACLFAALRDGTIEVPCPYPWLAGSDHA